MRRAEARTQARLRAAMSDRIDRAALVIGSRFPSDRRYIEGLGYQIGDITCRYNARSGYIRCAVNPLGPCSQCPHYESMQF